MTITLDNSQHMKAVRAFGQLYHQGKESELLSRHILALIQRMRPQSEKLRDQALINASCHATSALMQVSQTTLLDGMMYRIVVCAMITADGLGPMAAVAIPPSAETLEGAHIGVAALQGPTVTTHLLACLLRGQSQSAPVRQR